MIVKKITDFGRNAVSLENDQIRTVIDALGGMMPEFSLKRGQVAINAHWIPDFRGESGKPYNPVEHANFWKEKLLYLIAGDFPCSPNFGGPCLVDGVELPAHGWVANEEWAITDHGVSSEASISLSPALRCRALRLACPSLGKSATWFWRIRPPITQ